MILAELLLALSLLIWGWLLAYSILLVMLVYAEETGSMYRVPMEMALNRFVDVFRVGWLKPIHTMQLQQRRLFSYGLFAVVALGVALASWFAS